MAATSNSTSASRFHNLSDAALADEIGRIDSISKAAESELKSLKDEFKSRGLTQVSGDAFAVTDRWPSRCKGRQGLPGPALHPL